MQTHRVVVAGSRGFSDYALLCKKLDTYLANMDYSEVEIISGTARGADTLGERYAEEYGIEVCKMPADWKKHGRAAGYLRNQDMCKRATHCIVFWDGVSRGSSNMIRLAKDAGLPIKVIRFTNWQEEMPW